MIRKRSSPSPVVLGFGEGVTMWLVLVVWGFESEVGDVWWLWFSGGGGVCSVFCETTWFSGGGGGGSVKWVMYVYLYVF
ncbi:hypothetical protein Hanom_Chr12g01164111 [Helianthus anomalus]